MSKLSSAQAWLREHYQRSSTSSLIRAIKPHRPPKSRGDKARALLWRTLVEFRGENIALRSAALTYITLFSLVPMLAVAFAIIRAIGQDELRQVIHEFIFTNLVPGTAQQLGTYIDTFISRASSGALGALGGFFLLVSAATLLSNIEISLNEIWGVQHRRSLLRQGLIYWCAITLGPILMGASLLVSSMLRSQIERILYVPPFLFTLVPLALTILFFLFLYIATPNARVRTLPAVTGAVLAGLAWEAAKHAFAVYTARSISYNAIYGSLGAIPLFLFWIYICWYIFLFGARIAFALQHALTGTPSDPRICDARTREILYVRLMLFLSGAFLEGKEAPTLKSLSEAIDLDEAYIAEALSELEKAGIAGKSANGFIPARQPSRICVADVVQAAASRPEMGTGEDGPLLASLQTPQVLIDLFRESDRLSMAELEHMTLSKLWNEIHADQPKAA